MSDTHVQTQQHVPRGPPSFNKLFAYNVSLTYNRLFQPKWNLIAGTRIALGQLPDDDILDGIRKQYHLVGMLSICEAFELSPVLDRILSARAAGCTHLVIDEEDFGRVSAGNLLRAAEFIHKSQDQSGIVYVHCKAGKGRSPACVMAYLMVYCGMDMYTAWRRIFVSRPHITVDWPKVFALHELLLKIRGLHCINNGASPEEERARQTWLHAASERFLTLSWYYARWTGQAITVQQKLHRRGSNHNGTAGDMWRGMKARAGQGVEKHQLLLQQYRLELMGAEEDYQTCLASMFSGSAAAIERSPPNPLATERDVSNSGALTRLSPHPSVDSQTSVASQA